MWITYFPSFVSASLEYHQLEFRSFMHIPDIDTKVSAMQNDETITEEHAYQTQENGIYWWKLTNVMTCMMAPFPTAS